MTIKMAWRRQPNEKGLASVGQGERGWELWLGKTEKAAYVNPRYEGWSRKRAGYYWVARLDLVGFTIPPMNTAGAPAQSPGEAIKDAESYVKQHVPGVKISRTALTKAGIKIPE